MGITRDDWLAALGDSVKPNNPDALTVVELAQQFGLGRQGAYLRIQKLLRAGQAKRVYKHVEDGAGRLRPQPAYVLVKAKAK